MVLVARSVKVTRATSGSGVVSSVSQLYSVSCTVKVTRAAGSRIEKEGRVAETCNVCI